MFSIPTNLPQHQVDTINTASDFLGTMTLLGISGRRAFLEGRMDALGTLTSLLQWWRRIPGTVGLIVVGVVSVKAVTAVLGIGGYTLWNKSKAKAV
jgi:hypothetical protein